METQRKKVLFVDDEPKILSSIKRVMDSENFDSLFAASGADALSLFVEHDIAVLVTDMRMPGMDGLNLLKTVREISPQTVRIVLSGYAQLSQVLATVNKGDIFQFLSKPWETAELLLVISQAIERYELECNRSSVVDGLIREKEALQQQLELLREDNLKCSASILHLHKWMFSLLKTGLEKPIDTDLGLMEAIQNNFISSLPFKLERISMAQTITDIGKACDGRLEMSGYASVDSMYEGYPAFLIFACKTLVGLIAFEACSAPTCQAHEEAPQGGCRTVVIKLDYRSIALSEHTEKSLALACSLLCEMGRAYDVSVKSGLPGEKTIVVKISWKAACQ